MGDGRTTTAQDPSRVTCFGSEKSALRIRDHVPQSGVCEFSSVSCHTPVRSTSTSPYPSTSTPDHSLIKSVPPVPSEEFHSTECGH